MSRLDDVLPGAVVRTHHRRTCSASPAAVWSAAQSLRLAETRILARLVRWRLPDTPVDCTYRELLSTYPFTVLEEGEHHSVSGLCGRLWTIRADYPQLAGPADFHGWAEPGTVRVAFATWVTATAEGTTELCQEARVAPVDRAAEVRLRLLWAAVGRFEGLIGSEAVAAVVRRVAAAGPADGAP